jgi:hypothetical protein
MIMSAVILSFYHLSMHLTACQNPFIFWGGGRGIMYIGCYFLQNITKVHELGSYFEQLPYALTVSN